MCIRDRIITIVCILYVTASCTTQKVAYRERFEDAKGYALYACIAHMNKLLFANFFLDQANKELDKHLIGFDAKGRRGSLSPWPYHR